MSSEVTAEPLNPGKGVCPVRAHCAAGDAHLFPVFFSQVRPLAALSWNVSVAWEWNREAVRAKPPGALHRAEYILPFQGRKADTPYPNGVIY
ncbi:MAG: hypothetical protein D3904_08335 [Candidatus Electrothrix sp. EH2]|nr:hypothetical protein [Candidatus Electrothrix sp. EH2]